MAIFNNTKRQDVMPVEPSFSGSRGAATVIAHGVRVEGDFSSQGDVVIEGEVHGNVSVGGALQVGPQARLKADVTAEQATVAGVIEGNMAIGSHLDLKATAKIIGDLTCETAVIESGATLCGKVVIGSKPAASPFVSKSEKTFKHAEQKMAAE